MKTYCKVLPIKKNLRINCPEILGTSQETRHISPQNQKKLCSKLYFELNKIIYINTFS